MVSSYLKCFCFHPSGLEGEAQPGGLDEIFWSMSPEASASNVISAVSSQDFMHAIIFPLPDSDDNTDLP